MSKASEGKIQQDIRLQAAQRGWLLLRNNSGACTTNDGRHIRFGLGNDSERVNRQIKSSDLIGIRPVLITPEMVGRVLGVFQAVECKKEGWRYSGDAREAAQQKFGTIIQKHGGCFTFASSVEEAFR